MGADFLTELLVQYTYVIMAPAAMLLGPIVSLIAGVLLRLGTISLIPTCLAIAAGELGGDVLWYSLGRRYGEQFVNRFGRYVGIAQSSLPSVKKLFTQHSDIIIFTSKITAGLGFTIPIFFTAGMIRVPFRRYMMLNIAGQFLWTAGLISIGYFLGHIYLQVGNLFEKMALLALIIIILASLVGFGRYLREQAMRGHSPNIK